MPDCLVVLSNSNSWGLNSVDTPLPLSEILRRTNWPDWVASMVIRRSKVPEFAKDWIALFNKFNITCSISARLALISNRSSTWNWIWIFFDFSSGVTISNTLDIKSPTRTFSALDSPSINIDLSDLTMDAARWLSASRESKISLPNSGLMTPFANFILRNWILRLDAPSGWLSSCAIDADRAPVAAVLLAFIRP